MASVIDICNMALDHIEQDNIGALDEGSNEADICSKFYDQARKYCLRSHFWNIADKTEALALSGESVLGFDFAYSMPAKCLLAREIIPQSGVAPATKINFKKVLNQTGTEFLIVTNEASAFLNYTYDLENSELFDEMFVNALSYLLASYIAKKLTGSDSKARELRQVYLDMVSYARTVDALEGQADPKVNNEYLDLRG
jgi:hypothetical protein